MTIKTTAWHYRVYQYWARFSPTYGKGYRENLCHYVRVLLFWAPMLWTWRLLSRAERLWKKLGAVLRYSLAVLFILTAAATLVALLGMLAYQIWIDPLAFIVAIGIIVGVVAGLALMAVAALGLGLLIANMLSDRKPPEIPGTVKLAAAYVMARKRRVCPFITFDEGAPSRS